MSKILVVAFSRTGNTSRLARQIASDLDADLELIRESRNRTGIIQYLRCAYEAINRKSTPIQQLSRDPAAYDLVIVGTPVWAAHISSPLRSFIDRHGKDLTRWAAFCTEGGSGHDKVFAELTELIGTNPLARLYLKQAELKTATFTQKVDAFGQEIDRQMSDQIKPSDGSP